MKGLDYYVSLLDNPTRLSAFRAGIEAAVRPGDRVLDLGTGVGTYAFLAARAGAGHVWGVDRDPVVRVARALAVANGLKDRVTFLQGEVPGVALPEVDVLIFEDFPTAFLDPGVRALLASVAPLLAPGGRTVPLAGRLHLAPVAAFEAWRRSLPPSEDRDALDFAWEPLRALAANTPRQVTLAPEHLLAPAAASAPIPLLPPPGPAALRVDGAWVTSEASTVHGLLLWFDLEVAPGVWLSNEPSPTPEPWRQLLLPVDPPLEVAEGARVEAAAWREGEPGGRPGWLVWELRAGGDVRRGHEFAGQPLELGDLGIPPLGG